MIGKKIARGAMSVFLCAALTVTCVAPAAADTVKGDSAVMDVATVIEDANLDYASMIASGDYKWFLSDDGSYYTLSRANEDGTMATITGTNIMGQEVTSAAGIYYSSNITNETNQTMLVYAPAKYINSDGTINRSAKVGYYSATTAPIVLENNCAGWKSGSAGAVNTKYIDQGMIYISIGSRSRDAVSSDGSVYTGKAPTPVADIKSGIVALRANASAVPGNTERIISVGTSGAGEMSSVIGVTGDMPEYYEYMYEAGAIGVTKNSDGTYSSEYSDAVYAAQCYCPIADLENADLAYAWMYYDSEINADGRDPFPFGERVTFTEFEKQLQVMLAEAFVDYVNGLGLVDEDGNALILTGLREGTYYDAILDAISDALNAAIASGDITSSDLTNTDEWLSGSAGSYKVTSLKGFIDNTNLVRIKDIPGFDTIVGIRDMQEADAFGTSSDAYNNFSASVAAVLEANKSELSKYDGYDADAVNAYIKGAKSSSVAEQANLMNAMEMLLGTNGYTLVNPAKYLRTRNGTADPHTSFTIAFNLTTAATMKNVDADYSLVWAMVHGDGEGSSTGTMVDWVKSIVPETLLKQTITVTKKSYSLKASALKKAAKKIKIGAKAEGTLSYKVTKGSSKYISVSKKGVITLKKGTPKGTYKVKVIAAGTDTYKKAGKTITIKVK
ncbi:MAG: hypothetical protein K6G40_10560 [Eubacterium sp.]|nr:hypothetical protein [Eubacterium sp.]